MLARIDERVHGCWRELTNEFASVDRSPRELAKVDLTRFNEAVDEG